MEILRLVGISTPAHSCLHRPSKSTYGAAIRCATAIGILLAFVLLCIVSAYADAASPNRADTRSQRVSVSHPAAAVAVHDASIAQNKQDPAIVHQDVLATDALGLASGSENGVLGDGIESGKDHAATTWHALLAVLFTLVVLTITSLSGWYRARFALKRADDKMRVVESEWQRRCTAVEMREQAAQLLIASRVATATTQERDRIFSTMRHFVSGPLAALAGLLEALDGAASTSVHRSLVGKIQTAVQTCLRALEDMLTPLPVESRSIALDENLMDVRELIDGVVALFSPAAAQKGLHLSVSIDRSVASRVFADSARLGQIVFHLLSHAIRTSEGGLLTVAVRAEPLNAGSQRIVICVRDVSGQASSLVQPELPWSSSPDETAGESHDDNGSFALCQRLAQCMGGELSISSERGFGTCGTFSAPFSVEHVHEAEEPLQSGHSPVPKEAGAGQAQTNSIEPRPEQFDQNYLEALSEEGIDLHTFLFGWRQSINDDLRRMREMCDQHDVVGVRAVLHRLSGAVGLVGARSLMESLRSSSVAQSKPGADVVNALTRRVQSLANQLETAIDTQRSNLP
ncbi:HAMP domain-containing sensor histidine kinase [Paraburkholderia sp. DHOC27]|uniref:sensor histidine kinase n=1 Tax=Paraburkholderia sp. DHOC27 TaxID=2303330 RepID=UPI000E3DA9D3|nr:HAMP domain-containing sensor histidine kinase [Paraburkholderia sp. DHOC27]RFU48758.1 hypothetical protein D0B32_02675 [Paraburkholderia sp. DHOC27]